jgi:hypothetical protein
MKYFDINRIPLDLKVGPITVSANGSLGGYGDPPYH